MFVWVQLHLYLRTALTTCLRMMERRGKKRVRRPGGDEKNEASRTKGKWIKDKHIMPRKERVYVFSED